MTGRGNQGEGQLLYEFRLDEAVPDDHLARKINALLDLSWVYAELAKSIRSAAAPARQRQAVTPSIDIDVRYKDAAFLSDGEGLGVNLLRGLTYRAGVAIDYDLGRDRHVQHRLTGTGNVGVAPEAKAFAECFLLPFVYRLDIRRGLGGHDGVIGDLGMYVPLPVAKNTYVFTGPSVTFADTRYMRAYFGITPAQASRSQFSAFNAHGGPARAGWGVTALHQYDNHWWLEAEGAWQYMLGDAGRSPIVEDKSQFAAGANLLYRF